MSTNHNRIRVADLETNESNKILKTNEIGELEFRDLSEIKADSYNDLDYTAAGKALDARQGKVLKDMIENVITSPLSLVNDLTSGGTEKALTAEMGKELNESKHPLEDQRLSTDQTVRFDRIIIKDGKYANYIEPFNIKASNTETLLSTSLTSDAIIAQSSDARKLEIKHNSINFVRDPYANIQGSLTSQYLTEARFWSLPDKDGAIALAYDFVRTAAGTAENAPLIIPNGVLTSSPQNGAIERDITGKLWTVHNGSRNRLIEDDGSLITLIANLPAKSTSVTPQPVSNTSTTILGSLPIGKIPNNFIGRIGMYFNTYWYEVSGSVYPTSINLEYYLRITNGNFDSYVWGTSPRGTDLLIYSYNFLADTTHLSNFSKSQMVNIKSKSTGDNGSYTGIGIQNTFWNTRNSNNSNNQNVENCSFQIVQKVTYTYADASNSNNNNITIRTDIDTDAMFIEKIR